MVWVERSAAYFGRWTWMLGCVTQDDLDLRLDPHLASSRLN